MSDNYTYSRPYGEAAFKIALEDNVINQWSDDLKILAMVVSDKDVKAVLADPKISQSSCVKLLMGFLKSKPDNNFLNFMNLLLDNKRMFYMKEISSIFDVLKSNHNNVRVVEVESPHQLSDDQIQSLKELFKNKYQSDIQIDQTVNSELIAGIKVKVNDEVIDLSLQNRFNQIKQQLII